MSLAEPLEVPETEVVMSALQNLHSQTTAALTLLAFLRGRKATCDYALVEEQLQKADAHLQVAVNSLRSMPQVRTVEVSPTIPWVAATPTAEERRRQKPGASITLRERGDILSRAVQARKLNHHSAISAEHDPICPSISQSR